MKEDIIFTAEPQQLHGKYVAEDLFRKWKEVVEKTDPKDGHKFKTEVEKKEIILKRGRSKETVSMPRIFGYSENSRGLGLADMAKALQTGRPFRANYEQQLHVVEVMSAFYTSSEKNTFVKIESPYTRQAPMKKTELLGILED